MICRNCGSRAELRDCSSEEMKYDLCDKCLAKIKENGVMAYKRKVSKVINDKIWDCKPLNYSWTPNGKVPVYKIEDAITIRVLSDLKKELDVESIEGSLMDLLRGGFFE